MKKVLIIQSLIKQYRKPFYLQLAKTLSASRIELIVAYGVPSRQEQKKSDNVELEAPLGLRVKNCWFFGGRLLYQPVLRETLKYDLVIVEQANKHLVNPILILLSRVGVIKIGFWGHGRNRQQTQSNISERIKYKILGLVDWWFAYTAGTADYLVDHGFPANKITNVQNSIDTSDFKKSLACVSTASLAEMKLKLGLTENTKVALFCGALYEDKKLEFLVDSLLLARGQGADIKLIVIGAGPQRQDMEKYSEVFDWLHYVGPCFGDEKALYFKLADVFVNPGLVGLSILDAFAAGLPFLTTDIERHGPEVEYLEKGYNGEISVFKVDAFANSLALLLTDTSRLEVLSGNALKSSETYTVEAMVENYASGIKACLDFSGRPSVCAEDCK